MPQAPAASSRSKKGQEEEDTSPPLKFSNGKDQRIKEEKNLKVSILCTVCFKLIWKENIHEVLCKIVIPDAYLPIANSFFLSVCKRHTHYKTGGTIWLRKDGISISLL